MGRAIEDRKDISKLQAEMKELQGVVEELSNALISTKQVHHVDMDEEFTPPAGTRKRTTKRKTAVIEKDSAEA
tara:strand:- start:222 stop:440 length:219 start_codon:yes stop_codon:yes gene_type:complete